MTQHARTFSPQLLALLREHLTPGQAVHTLGRRLPNWVMAVDEEGLRIETVKTRASGASAQLVPAWMLEEAWQRLTARGRLTSAEVVSSKDMSIKRSSAVCAVLATLPGVTASVRPIVLTYEP